MCKIRLCFSNSSLAPPIKKFVQAVCNYSQKHVLVNRMLVYRVLYALEACFCSRERTADHSTRPYGVNYTYAYISRPATFVPQNLPICLFQPEARGSSLDPILYTGVQFLY